MCVRVCAYAGVRVCVCGDGDGMSISPFLIFPYKSCKLTYIIITPLTGRKSN